MNRMPLPNLTMSRAFGDFATDMEGIMNRLFNGQEDGATASFVPRLDIAEADDHYRVQLDLPGVSADDIHIDVEDDALIIRGERHVERDPSGPKFLRSERAWGSFQRSVMLPKAIDRDAISAEYVDGVLSVTLPKRAEVKPRRIQINARSGQENAAPQSAVKLDEKHDGTSAE